MILDAYGIGEGDYKAYQEGFGDAADGVQDGNIDISIGILGLPAASIESLQASVGDVKMLGLSDKAIEYIEANSGYRRLTIPKETYDFLTEDIETVTAYAILLGNTDTIDEELGYQLAKSMIENAKENTHAQAKQMTLENALRGAEGLLIHPGAKRYYEEQGLTVQTKWQNCQQMRLKGKQNSSSGQEAKVGRIIRLAEKWPTYGTKISMESM